MKIPELRLNSFETGVWLPTNTQPSLAIRFNASSNAAATFLRRVEPNCQIDGISISSVIWRTLNSGAIIAALSAPHRQVFCRWYIGSLAAAIGGGVRARRAAAFLWET